jgi:hypothetical protein
MTTVAEVAQSMQTVLSDTANHLGRQTRFIRRQVKLTGALFTQILTFGWLADPHATLESLSQTAQALGVRISPQGLAERFTESAARCVQGVLDAAVQQLVESQPRAIPLLQRFNGVYLLDSTQLSLPSALGGLWRGCGGSAGLQTASLKVQVRLEVLRGQLQVHLQDGRASDRSGRWQHEPLPPGALRLADLGYFDLQVLAALDQQHAYWLTRPQAGTVLYTAQTQRLDLPRFLQAQSASALDVPVQLGAAQRIPARLLAVRVAQAVAERRRQRLYAEARRRGQPVSQQRLRLAAWTLYVTNIPLDQLSLSEALVLARTRWQLELLFKLWKDHARLDESTSANPWRILCELYAKLLGQLIQHWLCLLGGWRQPDHSWRKAADTIQKHALHLACAFATRRRADLCRVLHIIQRCLGAGCRIYKRRRLPSTFQLLLHGSAQPALA